MTEKHPGLEGAPEEVKLAVDLIYLLETNAIDPKVALAALDIVKRDIEKRVSLVVEENQVPTRNEQGNLRQSNQ